MYFGIIDLPEFTGLLTAVGVILAALFGFMKFQSDKNAQLFNSMAEERKLYMEQASIERRALVTSATADRENERTERMELTEAIKEMAAATKESGERQAMAIERQADEAKERNGHLAELELTSQEMFQKLADRNYQAITTIKEQTVAEQVVAHQTFVNDECPKRGKDAV